MLPHDMFNGFESFSDDGKLRDYLRSCASEFEKIPGFSGGLILICMASVGYNITVGLNQDLPNQKSAELVREIMRNEDARYFHMVLRPGNADITAATVGGAVTLDDTATNTDTANTASNPFLFIANMCQCYY
jgi:hypothetical protein